MSEPRTPAEWIDYIREQLAKTTGPLFKGPGANAVPLPPKDDDRDVIF